MLIALDMDGTLLNSNGQISQRNKEAIVKAQAAGHVVAIATGRAYKDAYEPLAKAGIVCPVIGLNGAMITLMDGTVIRDIPLNKQALIPILQWVREQPDLYCEIYTNEAVYVGLHNREHLEALANDVSEQHRDLKRIVEKQFQQARVTYVQDMSDTWNKESLVFYKILVFSLNHHRLKEASLKFGALSGLTVTSSHPNNIEVNHQQATKGKAVKALASYYGIDLTDTVVIGDSHNDLSMFAVASYRIAMGNASNEIKEQANFTTATNDEDGVAGVLEELVRTGCLAKR
ncbi:Cof-type HAD-IIB family hydrolase [Anoxybacillus sp. J5B_2022]|uniref:Cof-type HAD-IIB family hydrolase n=1 Tax=Anoxybacillus sp. J5B_2022 TaxID=3003246 RepID=UPI002285BF26|nr:Cof-type HAD-IIB family hydrolase [Anoxybacillus sp. J5B_2022]MCZ0754980.1 Cof-type HAD-IIB family hydrolase [Anoxybacillus sp. J5B_2022]